MNRGRIVKIRRNRSLWGIEYEIELGPDFSFDFSGSDRTIVFSVREVFEATKHIVYCDGRTIDRR